jgi:hypothetical protein
MTFLRVTEDRPPNPGILGALGEYALVVFLSHVGAGGKLAGKSDDQERTQPRKSLAIKGEVEGRSWALGGPAFASLMV